ncbi:hypothetical protein AB4Y32_16185 [Paraburkholderia phymatum]|uniref:Uncharacterized protein n=1 Tax=Paraburkholderia phymatum TaxID=148447 RepID=A0ACC6U0W1_9BURK
MRGRFATSVFGGAMNKPTTVQQLHDFLNAAASDGFVMDEVDAGDLFMAIFDFEGKPNANFTEEVTTVSVDELRAEVAILNGALHEAEEKESALIEALEHIVEYWNRDRNDAAMHNALWHIIETAESALEASKCT